MTEPDNDISKIVETSRELIAALEARNRTIEELNVALTRALGEHRTPDFSGDDV